MSGSHSTRVQPIGRLKLDLGDQRRSDDNGAAEEHDEDRGPVAGIGEAVVEPADLAARPQRQEALEQLAAAATRTGACQAGDDGLRTASWSRLGSER